VVVLEAIRQREHLTGADLVVDVGQYVEHLMAVQHDGSRAQTALDLMDQNLEISSQESWRRR
jgi:hypothetical protein